MSKSECSKCGREVIWKGDHWEHKDGKDHGHNVKEARW